MSFSWQGSVWERSVTAAVAVMGNGDGRVHSTKTDTSRCSLEMSDSSRDCRPSRTSHAGPAAPRKDRALAPTSWFRTPTLLVQHPCPLGTHVHRQPSIPSCLRRWIHHDQEGEPRRPPAVSIQASTLVRPPHHPPEWFLAQRMKQSPNQRVIANGTAAVCNALKLMLAGPLFAHHNPSHHLGNMNDRTTNFCAQQQDPTTI